MRKLLLLLTVVTLTFSAQADMMSLSNATYRHVKSNQVVKPSITQVEATALQANHQQRVITAMPEGELKTYKRTGVDELNAGKQISGVRYYNLAGQEMAQPSGMTIQVTTYTDGTRTATKVIK